MFYYKYNADSVITSKSTTQPTEGDYAMSNEDFDLDNYIVTIGAIDGIKVITYYTSKVKPIAELVKNAQENKADIQLLKQQNADLLYALATGGM